MEEQNAGAAEQPDGPRDADRNLLLEAVAEAGCVALAIFGNSPETQSKQDGSPVSEADLAVDASLQKALLSARPSYGWLSEESDQQPGAADNTLTWVIDPIDGTRAFVEEIPHWTISAALLDGDTPVLAAVFNPVRGEFFRAERGHGAFLNDKQLRISERSALKGSRLAVSQWMLDRDFWRQPWPECERVWVKSIAYRLALTASADYDAAIFAMAHDWDIAAAHLLIEEAGGHLTNRSGGGLRYDGSTARHEPMIAAGPALHAELMTRSLS